VTTTLRPLSQDDRSVVERLGQLYAHDLSEFRGTMPDGSGRFKAGRLPTYFDDPDRCGYLVLTESADGDTVIAGFAMVRGVTEPRRVVGEFFVVRAARRRGVGREAGRQLLERHPGAWEIPFQDENPGAARFWRRLATELVGDAWREERRPVPDKPEIPPDVWLSLTV
jgi:predicted acetyltransferase